MAQGRDVPQEDLWDLMKTGRGLVEARSRKTSKETVDAAADAIGIDRSLAQSLASTGNEPEEILQSDGPPEGSCTVRTAGLITGLGSDKVLALVKGNKLSASRKAHGRGGWLIKKQDLNPYTITSQR